MEIYSSPATAFVAGFIGAPAMNMITTQVHRGQITLARLRMKVSIPDGLVTVGIRPEHISITTEASSGGIVGRIEWVEALGAESILYVKTESCPNPMRVRVSTSLPASTEVWLLPMREHLHFFGRDGRRQGEAGALVHE